MHADGPPEERQLKGWPSCCHLAKVRVLDARAARCDQDLGVCEQRVASMAAPPGFWDSSGGRFLLIGLGFLVGMGATAGIAVAVE